MFCIMFADLERTMSTDQWLFSFLKDKALSAIQGVVMLEHELANYDTSKNNHDWANLNRLRKGPINDHW